MGAQDLREAHDEIASLIAIITVDRQQRSQEIIALCNEGVFNEQRAAVSLLHASMSIRVALVRLLGDDSEKSEYRRGRPLQGLALDCTGSIGGSSSCPGA